MATILVVVYPIAIYFGIQHFEPKFLALLLLAILILRLLSPSKSQQALASPKSKYIIFFAGLLLIGASFFFNSLEALKLYPVLINLSMLILFSASLYYPPSIIERFARIKNPELPPEGVEYTKKVTKVWCGFFVLNGLIALYTALFTSNEIWTLYNGLLSYLLMGVLFAAEFTYRKLFVESSN